MKHDPPNQYQIFRHICPRNCLDTCGIISYVQDGVVKKVGGDCEHAYTQGHLCAKGYAATEYLYSPRRLRFPLRQFPRGSGLWHRVSWDEAYQIIIDKILELNDRYGSNLALGYNKYYGNMGILHSAVAGMFNSIGPHTKPGGDLCTVAGDEALIYNCGSIQCQDPESMAEAKAIILWGANPAVSAIHQYRFIHRAKERGAVIIVIDPLFTATAAKADLYLQITPDTDALLALTLAKILIEEEGLQTEFLAENFVGWERFVQYLAQFVSIAETVELTGLSEPAIRELAGFFKNNSPCAIWAGFGLQRHRNGVQSVRAIHSLAAITGNIARKDGGFYYRHDFMKFFPDNLLNFNPESILKSRFVDINTFPRDALALQNPPLKILWNSCRNPLAQDGELHYWDKLLEQLDLMVTVDLYMTKTAEKSDLVLPAVTYFEAYDLNLSAWHYWIGINQKAIEPCYEAKSDLQIARELTFRLNQRRPGFSNFPYEKTDLEWIGEEFTPEVLAALELKDWRQLLEQPKKLSESYIESLQYSTTKDKFRLCSAQAKSDSLPMLPRFIKRIKASDKSSSPAYPLQLFTTQPLLQSHSQYKDLTWLAHHDSREVLEMNPQDAAKRGLSSGQWVIAFNRYGSAIFRLKVNATLLPGIVHGHQGAGINVLIPYQSSENEQRVSKKQGIAFYDSFIEIQKAMVPF